MLHMASNITLRGHTYYFRARIPTHLVSAYGRSIVSLSLRTGDQATAIARGREHRVSLERELDELKQKSPRADEDFHGSVFHLSDGEIDSVCERFRAAMLTDDEVDRIKGLHPISVEQDIDIYEAFLPDMRMAYAAGNLNHVHPRLRTYLKKLKLEVARQSPAYERLARRFQQAELEVYDAILKRRRGIAVDIPLVASDVLTIHDIYNCWLRRKAQNPKTARAFEQVFEDFEKLCLAPTARLVKKPDAVAFRNALQNRGELSSASISKQLGFLRAAFQTAVDDDLLESNPFIGVKVSASKYDKQSGKQSKKRLPFSISELNNIFTGPVYQPGFKPRPSLGSACYWLPPMALFSGARLEELAQLHVSDVIFEPEHGYYFRISESTEREQEVKNENSIRNVPVHPMLVEMGFIKYVKQCKGGRLFPALRKDSYGILSTSYSTWFGKYLDSLGITDESRVFHSFRHCFVELCKVNVLTIPAEVREATVGHLSAKMIEMVYGLALYPLAPQVSAMKLVKYPGLELAHLMPD